VLLASPLLPLTIGHIWRVPHLSDIPHEWHDFCPLIDDLKVCISSSGSGKVRV
jgi:hypothetical protein